MPIERPNVGLRRLTLSNFRNYRDLHLDLDGRHVCLFGPNGAGKTNMIEAISQFSPGRGLRSAAIASLARTGETAGWTATAILRHGELSYRIGIGLEQSESGTSRRIVRLDGDDVSHSALADIFRVVWLTPAMDRVFSGGASERRKFYDRQVMAHFPAHGRASATYEKAMRERNALLESPGFDSAWADAIERKMAESGAQIAVFRARIIERLQSAINTRPEGAFPKADLGLVGEAEQHALKGAQPSVIEDFLSEMYRSGRRRDSAAGRTLSGPHRADLQVTHRPTGLPAEQCSTGQQKALLISLILANARALQIDEERPNPLILLDEAAAHLDPDRRAALYDELSALDGQAWLTGTEAGLFDAFGERAQCIEVRDGTARTV